MIYPFILSRLIGVLQQLVDAGNTVLVIEHNLDIIKVADWIIDMGPVGGGNDSRQISYNGHSLCDREWLIYMNNRPAAPHPPREIVIHDPAPPVPGPPVHVLSALATVGLDAVWGIIDTASFATGLGILAIPFLSLITGGLCFISVLAVQRGVARDGWLASFAKASVLAVLAGVPFMVLGTAAGAILLGWAGLSSLSRLGSGR